MRSVVKKYTMVLALVVVFLFFTALTGGKLLLAQNISNLLLQDIDKETVQMILF